MNTSRNEHDSLQPAALVNAVRKSCEFGFFRVRQPTAIALPDFVRQTIGKMELRTNFEKTAGNDATILHTESELVQEQSRRIPAG